MRDSRPKRGRVTPWLDAGRFLRALHGGGEASVSHCERRTAYVTRYQARDRSATHGRSRRHVRLIRTSIVRDDTALEQRRDAVYMG
jgi:hypothetical protein